MQPIQHDPSMSKFALMAWWKKALQPLFHEGTHSSLDHISNANKVCPVKVEYRLRYSDMAYDYISSNIVELLGYTSKEIKRMSFCSIILETRIMSGIIRHGALNGSQEPEVEQRWEAHYLMRTKSGECIWVQDVAMPWRNEDGEVVGSVGALQEAPNLPVSLQKRYQRYGTA